MPGTEDMEQKNFPNSTTANEFGRNAKIFANFPLREDLLQAIEDQQSMIFI